MSSRLTLKPLLKPGVTDLVLTSAGQLNVRTYGRWTSGANDDFRELFVLLLDEIEPRAVERLKAGERAFVKVMPVEHGVRLRAVVTQSTSRAMDRVIEISLRVIPAKIPAPAASFSDRLAEGFCSSGRGFFLVTGGAGQGKSTFAATLVQEYLARHRARVVVLGENLEYFFHDDGLVSYLANEPTASAIEQALLLGPSLFFADRVGERRAKNRLGRAASTQIVVSIIEGRDTVSALQAWLGSEGDAESDLFASNLAGVITVELDGDGALFKPRFQATLFGDDAGEGEFALRALVAQRDWTRLRRRLQDDGTTAKRRAA